MFTIPPTSSKPSKHVVEHDSVTQQPQEVFILYNSSTKK